MAADRTLAGFVSGDEPTGEVPAPPRIGQRFEVLGLIGSGGMGSVYRVRDTELDEVVALKLLRGVTEIASVARFRQEVKLARRVTHPNVVRTFDLGEYVDGGDVIRFLTMQCVEGPSLTRLLAEAGPLKIERIVALGREIAAGVHAAHEAEVLHRDLKPDNILIADVGTKDEAALITDFGIARASVGDAAKTGVVLGTPAYMAPEQVRGAEVGPAADIYALGVILFEMTTGRRAFPGTDPLAVATARLFGGPPDPRPLRKGMPDALADVILRCMAAGAAGPVCERSRRRDGAAGDPRRDAHDGPAAERACDADGGNTDRRGVADPRGVRRRQLRRDRAHRRHYRPAHGLSRASNRAVVGRLGRSSRGRQKSWRKRVV